MTELNVAFLIGFIAVVSVVVWFYGPWQTWTVAWARQSLFELRDAWFDAASMSQDTRDLTGTRAVRDSINSMIRNTEMMTWPTIVMLHAWSRLGDFQPPKSDLQKQMHELPKELRTFARRTLFCASQLLVAQLLARSLVGAPVGIWAMWNLRRELRNLCAQHKDANTSKAVAEYRNLWALRAIRREVESVTAATMDPRVSELMRRQRRHAVAA